jgi:regulator of protease activity HflC (stomatin/prohibitin superfamily)
VFGIKYVRFEPNDYVLKYRKGNIVSEGAGLSFFYFAPTTSLVRIPTGSVDLPFIFQEVTADFQEVTVQGQITYVVAEPKKLASLMNFTLDSSGTRYASGDPEKLSQRIVNHTQVLTRATLKQMDIRSALGTSDLLSTSLKAGLQEADVVTELGVNVIGLSILAIRPTPDTARALEAEAREQILKEADSAIYARRNASVEQE